MSDISDTIQEAVEKAPGNRINSLVAIFVALTATVMAICNIKDGNICQAMSQAQAHAIDSWSFFQAKSTKQALAEGTVETIKLQNLAGSDELIKKYMDKIANYEKEKAEIKTQAENYQKEYDDLNEFDDQYDMTEAFLTIAIAMFGITALTQKKWLLYFAGAISLLGVILGITAFMNISLHSNFISHILG